MGTTAFCCSGQEVDGEREKEEDRQEKTVETTAQLPLIFETPDGKQETLIFTQRPLSFHFTRSRLRVAEVKPGSHSEELGLQKGWKLKAIAGDEVQGIAGDKVQEKLHLHALRLPMRKR